MKPTTRQALGIAISVALLAGVVISVARGWDQLRWEQLQLRPAPLFGSALLLLIAYAARAFLYAVFLRRLDPQVKVAAAVQIFFGSQAGRYAPGKVWQFAGAGALGKLRGGSATAAVWAALIVALAHQLAGAAIGLLALGQLPGVSGWSVVAALAAGALALAFIVSPFFPPLVSALGRRLGRELPQFPELPTGLLAASMPVFFAIWILFGLALWLFCLGTVPEPNALTAFNAVGIMAASCVAGYVVLIVPSGIGVREAAMTLLLSPALGPAAAGLVAIGLRLWMTLIEGPLMVWALGAALRVHPHKFTHS